MANVKSFRHTARVGIADLPGLLLKQATLCQSSESMQLSACKLRGWWSKKGECPGKKLDRHRFTGLPLAGFLTESVGVLSELGRKTLLPVFGA